MEYFRRGVAHTTKDNIGDLLTEADVAVSGFLVDAIHQKYPSHQIHSEEMKDDVNPGAEYEWVIDPIDGTRNFAWGIAVWCQMIAVLKNGELYLAAIYNPAAKELFFAEKGKGATLNGKPIHVNGVESLDHGLGIAVRATRFIYPDAAIHNTRYRKFMARLVTDTTVWMYNFGTMLGACYVASGGIDFFVSDSGLDHDNLAPVLICQEAGAMVTNGYGEPWTRYRQDIVIANPKLHPKVLELFH